MKCCPDTLVGSAMCHTHFAQSTCTLHVQMVDQVDLVEKLTRDRGCPDRVIFLFLIHRFMFINWSAKPSPISLLICWEFQPCWLHTSFTCSSVWVTCSTLSANLSSSDYLSNQKEILSCLTIQHMPLITSGKSGLMALQRAGSFREAWIRKGWDWFKYLSLKNVTHFMHICTLFIHCLAKL